jgi:hypothetical protein
MNRLWPVLLPELQAFPPPERDVALRLARGAELDMLELLAMAGGLVLVTALTRYGTENAALVSRFWMAALNFVVAVPLLAVVLGPFHLRRIRRGLREQLDRRGRE